MSRPDPLALLKLNPALKQAPNQDQPMNPQRAEAETTAKTRITIQIPRKLSKEIKKMAVDHEITRDQLIYSMIRQVHTNPELLQEALAFAKKLAKKFP